MATMNGNGQVRLPDLVPKGVMVSHGNLLHNEELIRHAFAQSSESVVLGWLPLHHDMGLIGTVLQPLYTGALCYLMNPGAFLQQPALAGIAHSARATRGGGDPGVARETASGRYRPEYRPRCRAPLAPDRLVSHDLERIEFGLEESLPGTDVPIP